MRHVIAAAAVVAAAVTAAVLAPSTHGIRLQDVPVKYSAMSSGERQVVRLAYKLGPGSGIVYVWAAANPAYGFDCSGFTMYVFRFAGIDLYHWAQAQYYDHRLKVVPFGQERPGDIVFFRGASGGRNSGFPGHVGIMVDKGQVIDYYSSGHPARLEPLSWHSGYVGARRWVKPPRVPVKVYGQAVGLAKRFHVKIRGSSGYTVEYTTRSKRLVGWAKKHHVRYRLTYDGVRVTLVPSR